MLFSTTAFLNYVTGVVKALAHIVPPGNHFAPFPFPKMIGKTLKKKEVKISGMFGDPITEPCVVLYLRIVQCNLF